MAESKSYFDEPNDITIEDSTIATEASFDETTTSRTGAAVLRIMSAAVLFSCTHVVLEWERAVVLRFGKFHRVAGPGLVFMCPIKD